MNRRLQDTSFIELLPDSIASDPTVGAVGSAIDASLRSVTLGVPAMLLWARLDPAPGRLSPVMQRLTDAAGGLKPLSEAELELLAWQLHVDFRDTAKTREQLAEMVRQSIPWHRIKGTPASIRAALALYGFTSVSIEEGGTGMHWATYQIGLPEIADEATVRLVARVAQEMSPARCKLFRIFNGAYDMRPCVWGKGQYGQAWYGMYSGVSVPDIPGTTDDFIVSFGRRTAMSVPALSPRYAMGKQTRSGHLIPYIDKPTWGRSVYGERALRNFGFQLGKIHSLFWGDLIVGERAWTGGWDDRPWYNVAGIGRQLPAWGIVPMSIAKAQAVYGETETPYGGLNSRYGRTYISLVDEPSRYGGTKYGQSQGERRIQILEFVENVTRAVLSGRVSPGIPVSASCRSLSFLIPRQDRPVYGLAAYGGRFIQNRRFCTKRRHALYFGERVPSGRMWEGAWDESLWLTYASIGREAPGGHVHVTTIPKTRGVYGVLNYGSPCAVYGRANAKVVDAPAVYGKAAYGTAQGERTFELSERLSHVSAFIIETGARGVPLLKLTTRSD